MDSRRSQGEESESDAVIERSTGIIRIGSSGSDELPSSSIALGGMRKRHTVHGPGIFTPKAPKDIKSTGGHSGGRRRTIARGNSHERITPDGNQTASPESSPLSNRPHLENNNTNFSTRSLGSYRPRLSPGGESSGSFGSSELSSSPSKGKSGDSTISSVPNPSM